MVFVRKIKKKSGVYLAEVKSYREDGKIKQKVVKYLGREVNGKPVKRVSVADTEIESVKESLSVKAVHHLSEELKLTEMQNSYWLVLAYSQILEDLSISKLAEWVNHTEIPQVLGLEKVSALKLYDSLSGLSKIDFSECEKSIYEILSRYETEDYAAVIDVTDTYFEGKNAGSKARRGKDSKNKKLVKIGLAVTFNYGFPIMHRTYDGNLSDHMIFKDLALELKDRNLKSIIMDRGMISPSDLQSIRKLKLKIIAGLAKTPSLTKKFINFPREEIYTIKNRVELVNTAVYAKGFDYENGRLIACYNPKTEYMKRETQHQKGEETAGSKYFGYSFIYHNTNSTDQEIIKQYYAKDIVERAFKQIKGVLGLRPVRVWMKNHIESHVKICYLSYAILSLLAYKTRKISTPLQTLENLKYGHSVTIKDKKNKHEWTLNVPLKPNQKKILKAIGIA